MLDQKPLTITRTHEHKRAFQLFPEQHEFQFAFRQRLWNAARVFWRIDSLVPHHHRSAAIFAFRNNSFEVCIVNRVIFDLHCQTFDAGIQWRAFRHRPRFQNAIGLKAKIVMQLRRTMFLDNEEIAKLGSLFFRAGLGRLIETTFLFVFGETHADSFRFQVSSFKLEGRISHRSTQIYTDKKQITSACLF